MATITIKTTRPAVKRSAPPPVAPEPFMPEIHLSARDSQIVLAALDTPPKPNAKLKSAAARFKRITAKKP